MHNRSLFIVFCRIKYKSRRKAIDFARNPGTTWQVTGIAEKTSTADKNQLDPDQK